MSSEREKTMPRKFILRDELYPVYVLLDEPLPTRFGTSYGYVDLTDAEVRQYEREVKRFKNVLGRMQARIEGADD